MYELLFLDKLSEPIHKLFTFVLYIAFLRQVRYIFRAETLTGQGLIVPHQSRKRYTLFQYFDVNQYPLNKEEGIFFTCQAKIQALVS